MFDKYVKSVQGYELLPLRLVLGMAFLYTGIMKVINPPMITNMLDGLGFPAPVFFAYVLMVVEIAGGAALILGLLTRFFSAALAIMLTVALFTVHIPAMSQGYALVVDFFKVLTIITGLIALFIAKPGRLSLDAKYKI